MIIGLIPARGGSKGIPGKNIKEIFGKPLIEHAISCGLECPSIDKIVVSTDSEEIAKIAKSSGADVPFIRPEILATDKAPMLPVLSHALLFLEEFYKKRIEAIALLDPTGFMRKVADVEGGISKFLNNDCDALVSCTIAKRNPFFNMVKPKDKKYVELVCKTKPEIFARQEAPIIFDLNTVIWIWNRQSIIDEIRIPKNTIYYEIPESRSLDLDSDLDWKIAKSLGNEFYER